MTPQGISPRERFVTSSDQRGFLGTSDGPLLEHRAPSLEYLRQLNSAGSFLRMGEPLGVVDVRQGGEPPCIYVFVATGTSDENMSMVRQLARIEWPDKPIVLAIRSPVRASGVVREAPGNDTESQAPISPRVPKAS
jgi:hypothetical protein